MSAFGPSPHGLPNLPFRFSERAIGRRMAMIIGPAPNDGVEHAYQVALLCCPKAAKCRPDFFQERMRVFLGRRRIDSAPPPTDVLSEEVEPLLDVGHAGLFGRELKAPFPQELLDHGTDSIFQLLFRATGDDEVIRIPNEVDLRPDVLP